MSSHNLSDHNRHDVPLTDVKEKISQDTSLTSVSLPEKPASQSVQSIEKMQWFLVRFSALLAVLDFIAFLITRDVTLLLGSSLLAYPFFVIVNFYFPRQRE